MQSVSAGQTKHDDQRGDANMKPVLKKELDLRRIMEYGLGMEDLSTRWKELKAHGQSPHLAEKCMVDYPIVDIIVDHPQDKF